MAQTSETHSHGQADEPGHESLRHILAHASHYLPTQGPIAVFVHHNTLHALEEHTFAEAAQLGLNIFGAQPYFSKARYREELKNGRIRPQDIEAVLRDDLGEAANVDIGLGKTRYDLQMAMLLAPIRSGPSAELSWLVAETNALRKFRTEVPASVAAGMVDATKRMVMRDYRNPQSLGDERTGQALSGLLKDFGVARIESWSDQDWQAFTLHFLWRLCQRGARVSQKPKSHSHVYQRPRDIAVSVGAADPDLLTHDLLIRFSASFLDQGFASWPLPHREEGFYYAFLQLFSQPSLMATGWLKRLEKLVAEELRSKLSPIESIERSIADAGIPESERQEFIERTLLALPGWGGMMWQMETNAAWTIRPAPSGTLEQFLAVRLLIERATLAEVADPVTGSQSSVAAYVKALSGRQRASDNDWSVQRAFTLFQVSQLLHWSPSQLAGFDNAQWQRFTDEVEAFAPLARRRIFQLAYEHRYATDALDALSVQAKKGFPKKVANPKYQVICCLDDREESFRRHLEEIEPQIETFGAAGFYAVAMYFRGVADAHYIPLCPVVIKPRHYVAETTAFTFQEAEKRRADARRAIGRASHTVHVGSRGLLGGILTALFGTVASIPMVARVLFPRLTARIRTTFGRFVQPPPVTQLNLERQAPDPGPENGNLGFSLDEMVAMVDRLLYDIGLVEFRRWFW